jgi:hypothetical protein
MKIQFRKVFPVGHQTPGRRPALLGRQECAALCRLRPLGALQNGFEARGTGGGPRQRSETRHLVSYQLEGRNPTGGVGYRRLPTLILFFAGEACAQFEDSARCGARERGGERGGDQASEVMRYAPMIKRLTMAAGSPQDALAGILAAIDAVNFLRKNFYHES